MIRGLHCVSIFRGYLRLRVAMMFLWILKKRAESQEKCGSSAEMKHVRRLVVMQNKTVLMWKIKPIYIYILLYIIYSDKLRKASSQLQNCPFHLFKISYIQRFTKIRSDGHSPAVPWTNRFRWKNGGQNPKKKNGERASQQKGNLGP